MEDLNPLRCELCLFYFIIERGIRVCRTKEHGERILSYGEIRGFEKMGCVSHSEMWTIERIFEKILGVFRQILISLRIK